MRNSLPTYKRLWPSLPLALAAALVRPATADQPAIELQPIIVTAERVKENIQSVGVSITALSSQTLNSLGITNLGQIASLVPGMQFNQFSPTLTIINLRGVSQNDFSDEQEAPIAVYDDDLYLASLGALAGSDFDLERVEVLRGPQGTLFGRNATGGAIQYIPNSPNFHTGGNLTVTAGNYGTWDTQGAINTPLTDDLAARVSFATDYHNPYIANSDGPGIEKQNQYAGRAQLLYKPTNHGEVRLSLWGINNDHETGAGYSWAASAPDATGRGVLIGPTTVDALNCPGLTGACVPGGDLSGYKNASTSPFGQSYQSPGTFNRTVAGATLHALWNFAPFTLTSITGYMGMHKRYFEDSAASPDPILTFGTRQHFHELSQELRLNGTEGALKWITGLYFLDVNSHDWVATFAAPAIGGYSEDENTETTRSEAAFGQLQYALSRRFTGILGLRYSSDQKTFAFDYDNPLNLLTLTYDEATYPTARHTYDNVTGKAELDYNIKSGSMLYASVNRGAKAGGWSAPASGLTGPDNLASLPFKQETLTSYELGEKLLLANDRVRLNGDVFYYVYQNYQGFFLQGLADVVENVNNAYVKGGELELAWVPIRGADVQVGVSHLESIAKHVPLPAGGFTQTGLPQAPRWSANAIASYDWWLVLGKLSFEIDAKYNTQQFMELLNASADHVGGYAVTNARVSFSTKDGHWEVAGWMRNLADKWYPVYALDLSSLGFEETVYAPPRTYGATVTYRWGP